MERGVAVVLLCWNNSDLIADALRRLDEQEGVDLERVVVDNGSEAQHVGRLERMKNAGHIDRLILSVENLGFAAGTNLGMVNSSAEHVLSLNADAYFADPLDLARLFDALEQSPAAGFANPRTLWPDGTEQVLPLSRPNWAAEVWEEFWWHLGIPYKLGMRRGGLRRSDRDRDFSCVTETEWIRGAVMLCKRQALRDVGYLKGAYFFGHEEQDLSVRAIDRGWKLLYVGTATAVHVASSTQSRFGPQLAILTARSKLQFWIDHGTTRERVGMRLALGIGNLIGLALARSAESRRARLGIVKEAMGFRQAVERAA